MANSIAHSMACSSSPRLGSEQTISIRCFDFHNDLPDASCQACVLEVERATGDGISLGPGQSKA